LKTKSISNKQLANKTVSIPPGVINRDIINLEFLDIDHNSTISVTSNPAKEVLRIQFTIPVSTQVHIQIFDIVGKKVFNYNKKHSEGSHSIELNNLKGNYGMNPGTYILRMKYNKGLISKKIAIN